MRYKRLTTTIKRVQKEASQRIPTITTNNKTIEI